MPIGNIHIAGLVSRLHRLALQAEQASSDPGVRSADLVKIFGEAVHVGCLGVKYSAEEMIDNVQREVAAGRKP